MESSPTSEKTERICSIFGFRHVVITLIFLGTTLNYIIRSSFSVALVSMVNSSHLSPTEEPHEGSCDEQGSMDKQMYKSWTRNKTKVDHRRLGETFDWDMQTQSFLLAAILYGSMAGLLLSSILTQRFGIRWVFGLSGLATSFLSLVMPLAANWGATAVIVARFAQGILLSSMLPVQNQLVSFWSTVAERSLVYSIILNGNQIGTILGMFVSGMLAECEALKGWSSIFYLFGIIGCLWSVLWLTLVTDSPVGHPFVSDEELKQIQKDQQDKQAMNALVPWKSILSSVPVWSQTLGVTGHCLGFFLLMSELPTFLHNVLHFSIKSSGALSAAPYVARFLTTFAGGYICDALRRSQKVSVTTTRKLMGALGLFGCAFCLAGIAFAGCREVWIVTLLCFANGFTGFSPFGLQLLAVDMSPTFSAILTGFTTTLGYLAGALTPYMAALLTASGQTLENWSTVFLVTAGVVFATGLQFLIFGSAERQPWDNSDAEQKTAAPKTEITRF